MNPGASNRTLVVVVLLLATAATVAAYNVGSRQIGPPVNYASPGATPASGTDDFAGIRSEDALLPKEPNSSSALQLQADRQEAERVARGFLDAWGQGKNGSAISYMTHAAAGDYSYTGLFSAERFVIGNGSTAVYRRIRYGSLTVGEATATFSFIIEHNTSGATWETFANRRLVLIKEAGTWKVTDCKYG